MTFARRLVMGLGLGAAAGGLALCLIAPGVAAWMLAALFGAALLGLGAGFDWRRFAPGVDGQGPAAAPTPGPPAPTDELGRLREELTAEAARRERAEEELKGLVDNDPLTGLPSRRLFADRLSMAIAHAHRHSHKVAVLLLGLDGFDPLAERLGRSVGDDLLRSVSMILERTLRQGDTITRLESDEFAVLLPGINQGEDVGVIADKLRLALRSPFTIGGQDLIVTASMGVALYPDDGPETETLLRSAATAMQRARERGGDTFDIHSPETKARAAERQALENALRKALVQGDLALYYQPVVECETGAIVSAEALLRWRDPDRKMVTAAEFVPLADATLLAVPLGQWALKSACRQARAWRDAGHEALTVEVNVSHRQFHHPALVKLVKRVLEETGLPPSGLELEIAEAELARNPDRSIDRLAELKEIGVRISIDDFGAGESVLSQLYRYPADTLKIATVVTSDIGSDRNQEAVATAAITLARTRRLRVVAKGVETEPQRVLLTRWQCDCMQGNLCGEPLAADEFGKLLERQKKAVRDLAAPD
jgi:diguanylate cyclase (GGDEF)-like protein